MSLKNRTILSYAAVALLLILTGFLQSWSVTLVMINLCLISAIMALGVNIQWGYAGLFSAGTVGFTAVGGLAGVLISEAPIYEAWGVGGTGLAITVALLVTLVATIFGVMTLMTPGWKRRWVLTGTVLIGYFLIRLFFDEATDAIEKVDPASAGFLGGLGLPILLSWPVGGLLAALVAWGIGKVSLGLRADYLAIATLGIGEIVIAVIKNEDWLSRGVKNVAGLDRPVPREIDLQESPEFISWVERIHSGALEALTGDERAQALRDFVQYDSGIFVKLCFMALFAVVLLILFWLAQRSLNSPWGRMMRAIRDNEVAAEAMGKNVTKRHLQTFILGAAVVGIAGAMLTTLDGQLTPGTYNPLRYTFLIWVMVIVGGSGNNHGSVIGAFLIWFAWVQAEPAGAWFLDLVTSPLAEDNPVRLHLLDSAAHMRPFLMGLVLLLVMRFSPKGILPEPVRVGR
ncbi:branched-chain amino acid ABC transporter permease [Rhodospirillaceae bacterium KN72]|uniref:Branched-chain amino acid ABC transporter permease n=1 Tax=Pacificispira spongiicola TaxID=2729598 RepID=A0A7Y0E3F3_9PROT|nr:branched-chain amino acid ABC transporter permease [Pacificispira spongiicola]NMM46530.1 branched-chain amino acid ABC transporter permease [Pacificispira spongiicola]